MKPPLFTRVCTGAPRDRDVFADAVLDAVRQAHSEGSRMIKIHDVYRVTQWEWTQSTSKRIHDVFAANGMVKFNDKHYTLPQGMFS